MPGIVIADPELTVGLPAIAPAQPASDAFTHCFEAYCAPGFHPLADGIALEAMRLISVYLPRLAPTARYRSPLAHAGGSQHGRTAFQKGLGGVHAMAHPVGPFSTLTAPKLGECLPVMVHNRAAIADRGAHGRAHAGFVEPPLSSPCWPGFSRSRQLLQVLPHTLAAIGANDECRRNRCRGRPDVSAGGNPVALDAPTLERPLPVGVAPATSRCRLKGAAGNDAGASHRWQRGRHAGRARSPRGGDSAYADPEPARHLGSAACNMRCGPLTPRPP